MNRIARSIPWLLVLLFALSVLSALFILSPCWFRSPWSHLLENASDRINMAQFVVETAGFSLALMAGLFAASEFRRNQLRPSLRLFLYDRARDNLGNDLRTTKDSMKSVPFDIVIRNEGLSVARFVKVRLNFTGVPPFATRHPLWGLLHSPGLSGCHLLKYWSEQDLDDGRELIFDGKDEYVCYPGPDEILGSFTLSIEAGQDYLGSPYKVFYWIYADRMNASTDSFLFHVVPPSQ